MTDSADVGQSTRGQSVRIRRYRDEDVAAVVELWRACDLVRTWNDPYEDIRRKVAAGAELFLVGEADGQIVASAMGGYDGHRGWINYLAVHPTRRREGFGRQIMRALEDALRAVGCPKINLQIREGNQDAAHFYEAIGYTQDRVVSLGKRLVTDG